MTDSTKNSSEGITILNLCLLNPPTKYDTPFKVVIKCGIKENETPEVEARKKDQDDNVRVVWNEPLIFVGDVNDGTCLTFIVRNKRFPKNITIGSCEHRAIDLLEMQNSSGLCKLDVAEECQLTFSIEKIPELDVVLRVVEQASAGLLPTRKAPADAANNPTTQAYDDNEKTWTSFVDTFQAFMKVMDGVSEINLYLKVAWSILSIIPKTIIAKKSRDDKVKQLCVKLKNIYEYIMDAERLRTLTVTMSTTQSATQFTNPSTSRWSMTLSVLVRQTIECAYFIQGYGNERTASVKNIIKEIGGSMDGKIQDFNDKLDHLMNAMRDSINLETNIVTLRVLEDTTGLTLLNDMPYAGALPLPGKGCLLGTRQSLIDKILKCINDDASPQVLVLSGQAGVGKTAVAHTIAGIFKEQNRLGSLFCFSRSFPNRRNCLFSTISRDLADGDTSWRTELLKIIPDTAVRRNEDPQTQFERLIVEPSKSVATIGPVVVVVDALDESGNRNERKDILEILFHKWSELPKNYRIIVTTRPEQDIEAGCQKFNIPCQRMGEIDAEETRRDIQTYVSNYLAPISSVLGKIDGDWDSVLAKRAEGLFQWAQTACQFIDSTVTRSKLVEKKWKTCVSTSSSSLYGLYHQIISSQTECQDAEFIEEFKTIVGAIITAREPLSINALQNIFNVIEDIESILTPFGSFFMGVHDTSIPVRPVHTSLFDFFASKQIGEETNEYYIDISNQTGMTLACLKLMNRMLCFNICQLETSHLRNQDVPGLGSRVETAIPLHLSYSCLFWGFHLQSSTHSEELVHEIRKLMDDKLLYYFEVLSLLTAVDRGCVAMREIVDWCKDGDDTLAADAMDAWEFGFNFGDAMTESTPHLYLSALPFAPRDSFVYRKYLTRFPKLFTFDVDRQPVGSSRKIGITQRHTSAGTPVALALSPKGRYIATGSNEGEFWVWNYVTGERLVSEVYDKAGRPPRRNVTDVVFSPDGELAYCCLSCGDIVVWCMATNETIRENYQEIAGATCGFCTISQDGRFIVWCRGIEEALLFDRKTHQTVKTFHKERLNFTSAAISPNGDWIALYRAPADDHYLRVPSVTRRLGVSDDIDEVVVRKHEVRQVSEVHIWNTRNHTLDVVSRFADGHLTLTDSYIAFKNHDSIEIRDLRTNTKVRQLRDPSVQCFHFSPDDQYILSSTYNGPYSIWSVSTGELISNSYVDGTTPARCLGFSHNSKSIAFYDLNGATHVRQWDKSIKTGDYRSRVHHPYVRRVSKIWLRGAYLILLYWISSSRDLRISDITTNTIVLDVENIDAVSVFSDRKNVYVAYATWSRLYLWNEKENVQIDEYDFLSSFELKLVCSDKYLIFGAKTVVKIWDSDTRQLLCSPIYLSTSMKFLVSVREARFAVSYGNELEVRECISGDKVAQFTFDSKFVQYTMVAFSASGRHVICISEEDIDILDASTGARVTSIPCSRHDPARRLSPDGKYLTWTYNDEVILLDTDTQAGVSLKGSSLDQPIKKLWFSNDLNFIITASNADINKRTGVLNIWNMQSRNMIGKPIRYPFNPENIETLALNNGHLIDSVRNSLQCSVWDLDTYEIMSVLYSAPAVTDSDADGTGVEGKLVYNKTEILDYALSAWKNASLPAFAHMDNGWVLGLQGEILFWVPENRRKHFWFPCMMHIPHENITKLNFTHFVHGFSWTKCGFRNDQ